jgi:broad specificity phosphatase PhoE
MTHATHVSAPSTRWTFLRHGQSRANAEGWYSGWDDVALTELGETEARRAAQALRDLPFARCLTSDLERAWRTAELVLAGRPIPVHRLPALRERHMGALQGKTRAEHPLDEARWLVGWDDAPPGGETLRAVVLRALAALRPWDDGRPTLVVAHGSLLRGLLATLEDRLPHPGISVGNAVPAHWAGTLPAHGAPSPAREG